MSKCLSTSYAFASRTHAYARIDYDNRTILVNENIAYLPLLVHSSRSRLSSARSRSSVSYVFRSSFLSAKHYPVFLFLFLPPSLSLSLSLSLCFSLFLSVPLFLFPSLSLSLSLCLSLSLSLSLCLSPFLSRDSDWSDCVRWSAQLPF